LNLLPSTAVADIVPDAGQEEVMPKGTARGDSHIRKSSHFSLRPVSNATTIARQFPPYAQALEKSRVTTGQRNARDLSVAVEQLHEEIRILRTAIDELRDDVVWAARQVLAAGYDLNPSEMPVRPLDPLAPDAEQRYRPATVMNSQQSPESSGGLGYCCENPRLGWTGDPESPGIECQHCGYLVADEGEVVIWRDATSSDEAGETNQARPASPQGTLFE
jgi:hypothetical protein